MRDQRTTAPAWSIARNARLRSLGFASYAAYLRSSRWQATKERFRAADRPQDCYCCGEDEVDLHHRTYERVGAERPEDLVPLCRRCHVLVHVLERRGDLGLDLAGLLDSQRAEHYARQGSALKARAMAETPVAHAIGPLEPETLRLAVMAAKKYAANYRRGPKERVRAQYQERKRLRREARDRANADERAGIGVPLHQRVYDP